MWTNVLKSFINIAAQIGNKYISALQNIASVSLFKGTYYKQAFRVEEMFDSH